VFVSASLSERARESERLSKRGRQDGCFATPAEREREREKGREAEEEEKIL